MQAVVDWMPEIDLEAGAIEVVPPAWVGDDELMELAARYDDLLLFERFADGTLLVTPPAGWRSSTMNAELVRLIGNWAHDGDRGLVMESSGGIELPDRSVFAPDVTFVAKHRWARADRSPTWVEVVADAAFELLSTSDRVRTTLKKIAAYLRNGVRLVVLIDPKRRCVYVGRAAEGEPRNLGDVERIDCSPEMPGFVLDVAAVLRSATG